MRKIRSLFREIKFAVQRAKRGYCDRDVWQIDTWFPTLMSKMLTQFSETAHVYPYSIMDVYFRLHKKEYFDLIRAYGNTPECNEGLSLEDYLHYRHHYSKEQVAQFSSLWREKLQDMAFFFSEASKKDLSSSSTAQGICDSYLKMGLALFVTYFDVLWDKADFPSVCGCTKSIESSGGETI